VTVLRWDACDGRLTPVERLSALPDSVPVAIVEANPFGRLKSAHLAMHRGGRLLLVSNRGYDSIAVFGVDPDSGRLQRLGIHPMRGATPRAFGIDPRGAFVYVANQDADSIDCYRIDPEDGDLAFTGLTTEVPAPACVVFGPNA
jgi:6-phosphogluconolactonase